MRLFKRQNLLCINVSKLVLISFNKVYFSGVRDCVERSFLLECGEFGSV